MKWLPVGLYVVMAATINYYCIPGWFQYLWGYASGALSVLFVLWLDSRR